MVFLPSLPALTPGPPVILSPNGTRAVAVDGAQTVVLLFQITNDVPLVRDEVTLPNFTRYDGIPSSSFSYSKNGSELTIVISSVGIYEDEGNYSVLASNAAGSFESIVYLDVQS